MGVVRTTGTVETEGGGKGWEGGVGVTIRTGGRPRLRRAGAAMAKTHVPCTVATN